MVTGKRTGLAPVTLYIRSVPVMSTDIQPRFIKGSAVLIPLFGEEVSHVWTVLSSYLDGGVFFYDLVCGGVQKLHVNEDHIVHHDPQGPQGVPLSSTEG